MSYVVDTHVHLNDKAFKNDLEQVIKRALDSGVKKCIVMGYDEASSRRAVAIAKRYDGCYAAVGLQPQEKKPANLLYIDELVKEPKVVAIGEVGIDLYWPDNDPLAIQEQFFKEQVARAIKYNLPLSIHARSAINEVLAVLASFKQPIKGVIHCFTEDYHAAQAIIKMGLYLGIGGVLTYKNAQDLRAAITKVPLTRIILETDAPYLSPQAKRHIRRNEPSFLPHVAQELATLKNTTYEEVIKITSQNAEELFKI